MDQMEEVYVRPMTPLEREKVLALKKLKRYIEKTDEPFSLVKVGQEFGLSSLELSTMIRLGMVLKSPSIYHLRYLYSWTTGEPTRELYKEISESGREYHRRIAKKSAEKKIKLKRREMEKKRALREAESKRIKKAKLQSFISQGNLIDPNNHDFVNTLKARCEGYTPERLESMVSHYAEPQPKQVTEEAIPITVTVMTQGNRKTININIFA